VRAFERDFSRPGRRALSTVQSTPTEILLLIEEEAEAVRTRFNPQSALDLEQVAKERYGVVQVIKTPLVLVSRVTKGSDGLYIFLDTCRKSYTRVYMLIENKIPFVNEFTPFLWSKE
jgi:hypothetical protein